MAFGWLVTLALLGAEPASDGVVGDEARASPDVTAPAVETPAVETPAVATPAVPTDGAAARPENDARIAVTPFRGEGVSANLGEELADLIALELEKFEGVDVLTRNDVRAVLDASAEAQLLGCDDPRCFVDANRLLPARRLLTGTVTHAGGVVMVQAALIDLKEMRALGRASVPLGGDSESIGAATKTLALALLSADPTFFARDVTIKGEVTPALIERVRIAQRPRGLAVRALGGAVASTSFAFGAATDPAYPGGCGRIGVDFPLLPWLSVTAALGGSYYTGRFLNRASFMFGADGTGFEDTSGAYVADYGIGGGGVGLGVEVQTPNGFVRPFARLAATGEVLALDVSDLVFEPDDGEPDLPATLSAPVPFERSIAPAGGLELAGGVDFSLSEHVGLSFEVAGYGKVHGLEKVFLKDTVQHEPLPPLTGVMLTLGAFYEL